jgi:hypothetical protein
MTLTWLPGAWSGSLVALKAIAAPVAATAAKGLSGVAGAQALAATSAAALAVAAALYWAWTHANTPRLSTLNQFIRYTHYLFFPFISFWHSFIR